GLERLMNGQQTRTECPPGIVEQVKACLRSGHYSRAMDLLRGAATEFSNDVELTELEKLAQDGVKRNAEAQRLITESQELFAQQKSTEALQLLRQAYELDKKNSLARAILANALVEHAHSFVETDWLEAERLTNQALAVNPAHPTAKTILSQIVDKKEKSSADDWVSHATKLQSSGDLFAALAWVAEGLAVHPDEPKLLHIQDAIQRDRAARGRQTRRRDLDELRKLEREIDGTTEAAAKQALGERIQAVAVRYWTDGEMIAIANGLLHRLGLVDQENSTASPHAKNLPIIFHVPRISAPKPSGGGISKVQPDEIPPTRIAPSPVPSRDLRTANISSANLPAAIVAPRKIASSQVAFEVAAQQKIPAAPPEPHFSAPQAATLSSGEPFSASGSSVPAAKVASQSSGEKQRPGSNSVTLILISAAAAIVLFAAIFLFTRKHPAPSSAKTPSAASTVAGAVPPARTVSESAATVPAVSAPASSDTGSEQNWSDDRHSEPAPTQAVVESRNNQPGHNESSPNLGTLLVIAGQDNARVFLNGKLQPQLTQAGQVRRQNLELKNYVVQVSKSGFQDPSRQEIRIRKGAQGKLIFNLQPQPRPQPRLSSLTIQGGVPGTIVFIDQASVGTVQTDGTLSVSSVNPGDHTVELRKERFKPRQFKEHFVAGGAISLAAADAALEAAPGKLKINFTPADAKVAIVKGDFLAMVSSGVPLNLGAGTYTLTARTADGFRSSSTFDVIAGQSKTLDLSFAPNGMSKWDDPGAWKHEKDSFIRKGGNFVLYGVVPASGTFAFSAMPAKGHLLQWVLNYTDPKNYVLFQMDDNSFHRTVIRNGEKRDEIIVPDKGDRKSFRPLHIRVSPTEIIHQIKHGDSWTVLDRWTQPGTNLSLGKFGFYLPGNDEVALSGFAHYADLNLH
ncbi:MAG: hypothetical protein ACRD3B_20075, partial [Candidatus Sulfotelmatobacter sp.]